jgi:hypothetical protein
MSSDSDSSSGASDINTFGTRSRHHQIDNDRDDDSDTDSDDEPDFDVSNLLDDEDDAQQRARSANIMLGNARATHETATWCFTENVRSQFLPFRFVPIILHFYLFLLDERQFRETNFKHRQENDSYCQSIPTWEGQENAEPRQNSAGAQTGLLPSVLYHKMLLLIYAGSRNCLQTVMFCYCYC